MGLGQAFQLLKATAEDIETLDCEYSPDLNRPKLAMHPSAAQSPFSLTAREPAGPLLLLPSQQRSKPFEFPLQDHPL